MQNDWMYLTGTGEMRGDDWGHQQRFLPTDTGCVHHQRQRHLKDEVCYI